MIRITIAPKYLSKLADPNHKDCSLEPRNLGGKHFYIPILPSMSFFCKIKKLILLIIRHGFQINNKMRALWKWERKQLDFYSRKEHAMILFNSVLENNYKIKIIFLIKFHEKWKKYLEILKQDMEKVKICNNN